MHRARLKGERDCSAINNVHAQTAYSNTRRKRVSRSRRWESTWSHGTRSHWGSEHWSQPSTSIAIRITAGFYGHTAGLSLLEVKNITFFQTRGSDCLHHTAELVHLSLCCIVWPATESLPVMGTFPLFFFLDSLEMIYNSVISFFFFFLNRIFLAIIEIITPENPM